MPAVARLVALAASLCGHGVAAAAEAHAGGRLGPRPGVPPVFPTREVATDREFVAAARDLFAPLAAALSSWPAVRNWQELYRVERAKLGRTFHGSRKNRFYALSAMRWDDRKVTVIARTVGPRLHHVHAHAAALLADPLDDPSASWARDLCASDAAAPRVALLSTADGAPPDHDGARAFYDLYLGPGCPYGHFIAFTLPRRLVNSSCAHAWPSLYQLQPQAERAVAQAVAATRDIDFEAREPTIVYRGWSLDHPSLFQDQRAALFALDRPWLNAKQSQGNAKREDRLSIETMARYRYQLDVGGNGGTSWDGLLWKLASGSLVFRVESDMRDWWHPTHRAWWFVPVRFGDADTFAEDLAQRYAWARANPHTAAAIARRGAAEALAASDPLAVDACGRGILFGPAAGARPGA